MGISTLCRQADAAPLARRLSKGTAVTRAFHGREDIRGAQANIAPGFYDPGNPLQRRAAAESVNPSLRAKAPASQGPEAVSTMGHGYVTPQFAAATMHNDLADNAKQIAHGYEAVPIHPAQVPSEGSDTQESEGDASVRDPTGLGSGSYTAGTDAGVSAEARRDARQRRGWQS